MDGETRGHDVHGGSAMDDSNRIIVEAWNTVLFDKFFRFKHLVVEGLSQHSDAALERCPYSAGDRVLDIGCGFGDSTLRIASRLGTDGEAVGIDCAEKFYRANPLEFRREAPIWQLPGFREVAARLTKEAVCAK